MRKVDGGAPRAVGPVFDPQGTPRSKGADRGAVEKATQDGWEGRGGGGVKPASGETPARVDRPGSVVSVREEGDAGALPRKMVGTVVEQDGLRMLAPLDGSAHRPLSGAPAPAVGAIVEVVTKPGAPQVKLTAAGVLAEPGTAKAKLYGILAGHGIDPSFPPEVEAEVKEVVKNPGLDDPALEDLTHLPFVTIDNEDSRDLDQAMHIERTEAGGYKVYYALADAAHYVRPGTALYEEAMKRGVTLYLPGMAVPMLPPELSEGIVSLNEGVERRALTMVTELDAKGNVIDSELRRTKIQSRKKLSYEGVQQMHDRPEGHPLSGQDFTETLHLLKEVGDLRIAEAEARDVVKIDRRETRHFIDPDDPTRFVTSSRGRNMVEKWNEQISLLCNAEGAQMMEAEGGEADYVTPIFKVHPEPVGKRLADFREMVKGAARAHGVDPKVWTWRAGETLAAFLGRLPNEGPHAALSAAIQRQAVMVNSASEFSCEPGRHHGVGVDPYARFSSPMREMVGIYTHKEALEKQGQVAPELWPNADPKVNQQQIVDIANEKAKLQKQIAKEADRLVLDQHLEADLERAPEDRPVWQGRILGLSATKAYVQMIDPPFEVKLYLADLAEKFDTELSLDDTRSVARSVNPKALGDLRMGDEIALCLDRYDEGRQRYVFTPMVEG